MRNITIAWLSIGFIVGWMPAGYALRALDEDKQPTPVLGAPVAEAPAVRPILAQIEAARSIPGAQISWDKKTGVPSSLRAQDLETVNLGGKGITLKAGASCDEQAIAVLDRLSSVYGIRDASQEFKAYRIDADDLDFQHVRVEQRYNGLPVFGADLIVHFNAAGKAYQVNGRYIPNIAVDTTPVLKPEEAVSIAQAQLVRWGKPTGTVPKQPRPVIYAHAGATPRLAYEFVVIYRIPDPGNLRFWVDAKNGAILKCYNDIQSRQGVLHDVTIYGNILVGEGGGDGAIFEVPGLTDYPNVTARSGAPPPGTTAKTSYYWYLQNKWKLWTIRNGDTTGSFMDSGAIAWRNDDYWAYSQTDEIEFSAAYNVNAVMDYFQYYVGRYSYDNSYADAILYVHAYYGSRYNNAFWDPYNYCFFFYDGDGNWGGLSVLDVVAHEFTHAVDQFTANLIYEGESGALNESFSDVFAAAIEFWHQSDGRAYYPDRRGGGYSDWLIGEDVTYPIAVALRDMRNPRRYNQPSKYQGTYWHSTSDTSPENDNGGVHVNSGVQNFMFYLLAEGGSGDNDGISYSVTGIGVANAMLVGQRALLNYCTRSTDFSASRDAWMSAANDLNSSYAASVNDAWEAVGITAGGGGNQYYQLYLYYYQYALAYYQQYLDYGSYGDLSLAYEYYAYAMGYLSLYQGYPLNIAYAYYFYYHASAAYFYCIYYGYGINYAEYYYNYYLQLAYYYYYGGS